jgi:hypothetical protein
MQSLPEGFEPLSAFAQWMCYKVMASKSRVGKFDKFPVSVSTGSIVDAHNPQHWVDYQTAIDTARLWGDGYGVAFVFTENDPFFFVDIDGAYDGSTWSEVATQLCAAFPGAAIEVSHSCSGLHIIGQYTGAEPDHACKNIPLGLELYTSGRFIALTGTNITGTAATVCDAALATTIAGYFGVDAHAPTSIDWTTTHRDGYSPIKDDEALLEKMFDSESSANRFGKCSARDLYECNADAIAVTYPDDVRDYDASSADAALAQHLAFWTCGNCERIETLMRDSELARDKWDYHRKYLNLTIRGAVARTQNFYSKGKELEIVEDTATAIVDPLSMRDGFQLMPADQQIKFFAGCVYVCDAHRMFTPRGVMMKVEQFNAMYGGYTFAIDVDNDKTTKKAFEAFTESQAINFPKADTSCFRPLLEPGAVILSEGLKLVNTYVPLNIATSNDDVTRFTDHVAKLLPVERDRTILMSYMAACIQFKGYKIKWAPLLQGVEGNGKSLLTYCMMYAIGERYSHMPPAAEISEKFNSWLFNSLFIGVEDIYVPDQKREVIEVLKPMITGTRLARRAMNTDQVMSDVCCNFLFNSNHKDAVRKTSNDRRFCIMYTAQQETADITRDGMAGNYFPNIYKWLRSGGFAAVTGYLMSYKILEEFNPTTQCQRAPDTSSTSEAISMSLGGIEQEIIEAIEEARTGFAGGWVSSFALDKMLKDLRKDRQFPQNRRRQLMQSLGYDWHPTLRDGRVNNVITIDAGKPRLFIKNGHIHSNLETASKVAQYYAAAQGDPLALRSIDDLVISN